jgi:hypothetical protein
LDQRQALLAVVIDVADLERLGEVADCDAKVGLARDLDTARRCWPSLVGGVVVAFFTSVTFQPCWWVWRTVSRPTVPAQ